MKLGKIARNLIVESRSTPTIVVDVQPAYDHAIGFMSELIEFINNQSKVMIMFNGTEVSPDSKDDVMWYWIEHGLSEDRVDDIMWVEKTYGFFRNWMDRGIDDRIIKATIRDMITQRIYDTRELDQDVLRDRLTDDEYAFAEDDPMYMPEISIKTLHEFKNCYICGGGEHECLREITHLMNALNFKYTYLQRFIYT